MTDLLDPSALLHVLQQLLPSTQTPSATTSSSSGAPPPQLCSPADALSAMIHTVMIRLDFRLTGLSDDDRLPNPPSSSSSSSSHALSSNKLPPSWNAKGPDHYCFRYKHHQSSLDYLVKVVKLGNKAVIHGIALQGSKTSTLEIPLADYFSPSFFPYPHPPGQSQQGDEPLVNGFIGSSRLKDLVIAFKTQILQTLVPGLRKEGYTEQDSNPHTASSSTRNPPPATQPSPPFAGDEGHPSRPSSVHHPPFRNPLTIGDRDLDPLGGAPLALPPRFGGGGAGGGFAPPPLFPGGDSGGGMYVGPDHPMFRNRFPPHHPGAPPTGLPPGAVPPGARFDPIYPATHPSPFNPDNPDVGGARPQPAPPLHGEPDWDDLAPPTSENPFAPPGRVRRPPSHPDTTGWYS